jgi:hypothetical protein
MDPKERYAWLLAILILGLAMTLAFTVNRIVDRPYMDEPFHVDMVQHYHRGDYSYWNDKVTTPPGL